MWCRSLFEYCQGFTTLIDFDVDDVGYGASKWKLRDKPRNKSSAENQYDRLWKEALEIVYKSRIKLLKHTNSTKTDNR